MSTFACRVSHMMVMCYIVDIDNYRRRIVDLITPNIVVHVNVTSSMGRCWIEHDIEVVVIILVPANDISRAISRVDR